jgi:hypothetical protein
VIVFFGHFIENNRSSAKYWATFFQQYQSCINLDQKWVGLHFGRLFHKLVWSRCSRAASMWHSDVGLFATFPFYRHGSRGRCYYDNFQRCLPIFGEKNGVFLKTNVMIAPKVLQPSFLTVTNGCEHRQDNCS